MLLKTSNLNSSTTFTFKKSKGILQKANKHKRTYLSRFNATHHFRVSRYFEFSTNAVTPEAETPAATNRGQPLRRPGRSRAGVSAPERSSRAPPAAAPGRKTLRETRQEALAADAPLRRRAERTVRRTPPQAASPLPRACPSASPALAAEVEGQPGHEPVLVRVPPPPQGAQHGGGRPAPLPHRRPLSSGARATGPANPRSGRAAVCAYGAAIGRWRRRAEPWGRRAGWAPVPATAGGASACGLGPGCARCASPTREVRHHLKMYVIRVPN